MKKLNERKKVLVEILKDYNRYFVEIVNTLMEGRYAGLGMCVIQDPSDDDPLCLYGCYSTLKNVERTKRLVDIFRKNDFIEGHENDRRLYFRSYDGLVYSISRIYSKDVERMLHRMNEFQDLITKFDACGFTPAEVRALSHLLFFEQVSLVPKAFVGHHPSFNMILNSFFSTLLFTEFSIDFESQPHEVFKSVGLQFHTDVDLDELYKD